MFFDSFLKIYAKNIEYRIDENNTDKDKPIRSNWLPRIIIKITNEPILTNAEYPTFVDPWDCNLALKIAAIDSGIKDKIRICRLGMPSESFGNTDEINMGAKNIIVIAITIEIMITMMLIFLWDFPLDSSDSKKECNDSGSNSRPTRIWIFNW